MQVQFADLRSARRKPHTHILLIGIVGAIHIAAIWALVSGLLPKAFVKPPVDIGVVDVAPVKPPNPVKPTHIEKTFIKPTVTTILPPDIPIDWDSWKTIAVVHSDQTKTRTVLPTSAQGITNTHTIPAYPQMAIRLGQQGTVTLRLTVSTDGSVSDAQLETSSGSTWLDDAAIAWVKAHWRYKPATQEGTAVPSTTLAAVVFNLKDAR